jgi:predicted transposase YdaD
VSVLTLQSWLPAIVALIGAAAAWGASQSRLATIERIIQERDDKLDAKLDKILDRGQAHETRITRIEDRASAIDEKHEGLIEATRDALESAVRRIDAIERELRLAPESPNRRRKDPP